MLLYLAGVLLAFLATADCRDIAKPMKSVPTITNSLVNLGKMDLSFYFSGRAPDAPYKSSFFSKPSPMVDLPCPCSSMRNKDSFFSNPSELINKILMSHELFSNKEPLTSTLCCDSHEHVQEDTVLFEFGPTHRTLKANPTRTNPLSLPPFLFDSAMPNKGLLPPFKSKAVEIFLFPKKKDMATFDFTNVMPKRKDVVARDDIKIVGDKNIRNDFKRLPPPPTSSVKKDLSVPIKEKVADKEVSTKINVTDNYPNVL